MNFTSNESFLASVYAHLEMHMEDEEWSRKVGVTEIASGLLMVNDLTVDSFVLVYFDPYYHQPLEMMRVCMLPLGIAVWQADTTYVRAAITLAEIKLQSSQHAPRHATRAFGSLKDLRRYAKS